MAAMDRVEKLALLEVELADEDRDVLKNQLRSYEIKIQLLLAS